MDQAVVDLHVSQVTYSEKGTVAGYILVLGRTIGRHHYLCPLVLVSKDINLKGPSWLWSYGSCVYNYMCNQCLSSLMLWVRISIRTRCTTLCDYVCQWLATGRWFSLGSPVSSTNKTDCHDIT